MTVHALRLGGVPYDLTPENIAHIRRVLDGLLDRQARAHRVLAIDIHQRQRVGGNGHVGGIELLQLGEVIEDAIQLAPDAAELLLGEGQFSEAGDMPDLLVG